MRGHFIKGILVLILVIIIYNIYQSFNNTQNSSHNQNQQEDEVLMNNAEVREKNDSETGVWATLDQRFNDFTNDGAHCIAIENIKDRGDCFQKVLSNYLIWYLDDQNRFHEYLPYDESAEILWTDLLYGEINELDILDIYIIDHGTDYNSGLTDSEYEREMDMLAEHWYVFSNIVPQKYRDTLKTVYWTDTGRDSIFGVSRENSNPKKTSLIISKNNYGYNSEYKSYYFHELAHMLTLNENQVKVDEDIYLSGTERDRRLAAAHCETYYTIGCLEEASYLSAYFDMFWQDSYPDFLQIYNVYEHQNFYAQYEDHFFNSYQALSPEEDIAESFVYFLMLSSQDLDNQTEVKYEKVKFFYDYEELVTLRTTVLENIYDLCMRDQYFY